MMGNMSEQLPHCSMNADMMAIRDYVQYDTGAQNQADSTVRVQVSHSNLKQSFMEIRLEKHMTILRVKEKLAFHTGTSAGMAYLTLMDHNSQIVADCMEDDKMLGYYSPQNGYIIHITDLDPYSHSANGGLEDLSLVEKYKISDEDYEKRPDNFRKFKAEKQKEDPNWTIEKEMQKRKTEKMRKLDPNYQPPPEKVKITDEEHQVEAAAGMKPGDRCQVAPGDRRGLVKYVGKVEGIGLGYWVGVQYDEPLGKNDGSVKGERYFECPEKYGGFVRPENVEVGDFPEIDEFALTDEEEEDCQKENCNSGCCHQNSNTDHEHSHGAH